MPFAPPLGWRDGPETTLTRRRRFSGPVTGALCKLPFAGFVEKCRVRGKRPLPDNFRRFRKTGAEWPQFKTATVRDRPEAVCHDPPNRS